MSGFSIDAVSRQLSDQLSAQEAKLGEKMKTVNTSNPREMQEMQNEWQKYSNAALFTSTFSKNFFELIRSILQKMG